MSTQPLPITLSSATTRSVVYNGLRNPTLDRWFILGIPTIALSSLAIVLIWPSAFYFILALDLWLLGYHHVIATYTRIGMDRESFSRHWKLLLVLPFAVAAGVYSIGIAGGASTLTTIYFYWLWFHYIRQSEGVSKAYAARGGARVVADAPLHRLSFYAIPTAALLQICSRDDNTLLGVQIAALKLPDPAIFIVWLAAISIAATSLYQLHRMARNAQLPRFYLKFLYTHYAMFILTYGLVDNLTVAWLGLNVWHNLQYLTFVWLSHERRFNGEVSPKAVILSTIAKPKNILIYICSCLTITFVLYMGFERLLTPLASVLGTSAVLTAVMLYQTVNFHHYIVDAIIWRRPKQASAA